MKKIQPKVKKGSLNKAIVIGLLIGGTAAYIAAVLRKRRKRLESHPASKTVLQNKIASTKIDLNEAEDESDCKTAEWDRNGSSYPSVT